MINIKTTIKALTLVETVIYMALFSFLMMMVMQFVFIVDKANDTGFKKNELERSVVFISQHLKESFNSSNGIDEINTLINDNNGVLTLNHNGSQIKYSIDGQKIMVTRGTNTNYITTGDYVVEQFLLEPVLNTDGSLEGLKVTIKITDKKDEAISRSFSSYYKSRI